LSRIAAAFAGSSGKHRKILIPFISAGDPSLEATERFVLALAEGGAGIIELGVPFSDPVADGPTIQRSTLRALDAGTTLAEILKLVVRLRTRTEVPLVLMSYYNPILQYGLDKFVHDAVSTGVDGVIIPDLPLEEAGVFVDRARPAGLDFIPLVAPTSTPERIRKICSIAGGFVYCVTVKGVTGSRKGLPTDLDRLVGEIRKHTGLPVAMGFGITTPAQAGALSRFCDGVIVGSAFVDLIAGAGPAAADVLIRDFAEGLYAAIITK
jgi:tryptophan synthase alpha chain